MDKLGAQPIQPQQPELTPQQKKALAGLHTAATQLEGVFLDMLFTSMRSTVSKESVFGKENPAEETFQSMLDEQRSQAVAQSGSFGIARVLEEQLRASVLSDAGREAKTQVPKELEP
jgi:flagellar protein FlgJ